MHLCACALNSSDGAAIGSKFLIPVQLPVSAIDTCMIGPLGVRLVTARSVQAGMNASCNPLVQEVLCL
jgi:hypothetical protein